jgi:signal transduction histidine kinase
VVIERVLVENEEMPLGGAVRVAPGKESLQFQYTALSFAAPGKVAFRYQLEGFDRAWSEVQTIRTARYPKVPPGEYRFRVVARNNDGVWNESGAALAVVVVPFWWATNWFRLVLAVGAVGALVGLYRLRQTRRREIERLRVRIASDLHDDVGSSLWSITLLSRMLSKHGRLEGQERQDVDEIHRIAVQTSNSIRDIIWLINPAFDTMQDLVLRTKDFAGTALRGVEYRLECDSPLLTRKLSLDFRQNLFFLFKEALTNIARHAQATVAEARVEERDGRLRLSIQDNGIGFDPTVRTGGNGLRNLRARAVRMGAELEIHSRPGEGTTLVLTVGAP